jgi:hypothetical protein
MNFPAVPPSTQVLTTVFSDQSSDYFVRIWLPAYANGGIRGNLYHESRHVRYFNVEATTIERMDGKYNRIRTKVGRDNISFTWK